MSKDKARRVRKLHSLPNANLLHSSGPLGEGLRGLLPSISVKDSLFCIDEEFEKLNHQVAGHQFLKGKDTIGMLKCKDGTVLKPVTKPEVGNREIQFYEQLQATGNTTLPELKQFCPNYYGTRRIDVDGTSVEFLILENLTEGLSEPCVIDIKIGRQTWDPTASEDKIAREKKKYAQCKQDVAFCIPGFQVYKISTGRVHKYNKDYGKKLNGKTVNDALRLFLNGDGSNHINRELLMQLLTLLWKIQKWAKTQTSLRLYSTSLLMVYDCKILKRLIRHEENSKTYQSTSSVRSQCQRKMSFNSPEGYSKESTGCFSGQISTLGPILTSLPPMPTPIHDYRVPTTLEDNHSWHKSIQKVRRSHSFHSNYNDYLSKVKQDYASVLEELNDDSDCNKPWCNVKIIDFAHVFPSKEPTPDLNYIEGIDKVVALFEDFLNSLS